MYYLQCAYLYCTDSELAAQLVRYRLVIDALYFIVLFHTVSSYHLLYCTALNCTERKLAVHTQRAAEMRTGS
jgi:hypothetical protein